MNSFVSDVDVNKAIGSASYSSCRKILEELGKLFIKTQEQATVQKLLPCQAFGKLNNVSVII